MKTLGDCGSIDQVAFAQYTGDELIDVGETNFRLAFHSFLSGV